ncbi:hypothetical protein Aperf_G00000104900 [Anoplocephala perfoliata]
MRELQSKHLIPNLLEGEVDLALHYKGILADDMLGFYRSICRNEDGKEGIILSTHFESTFARRAFPCFDEPDKKAVFRISIVAPDHLTVLSCMPEISRTPVEDSELRAFGLPTTGMSHPFVKVSFDDTPRMSTYIVAFVIGHLDYTEATDANGVRIRVYTPPSRAHLGAHALRMAKSAIAFFTEVFGAEYPLPKLDLVAIPDFAMGAMENWGLLTYRETALLIDEKESSLASKRQVALTVAHECAHMWFGNLVTMEWWTDLWLNEGFATWISYLGVDHCFPDYDIWTNFLTSEFNVAMEADGLKTSHPIEVDVHSPEEIDEIFDAVSYEKGASIIRMINDYMSPEVFKKGLQLYIQRHKYGNTATHDLWNALSAACGEDISVIMFTWTRQMGFPVLTVRQVSEDDNVLKVSIEQERFLADGSRDQNDTYCWHVPVTICNSTDSNQIVKRLRLPPEARKAPHIVELPAGTKFRLNPGAVGFYRVHYEDSLMGSILEALGEKKLDHKDRLYVLADTFALARAGRIRMTSALTMASTFSCETDYTVWCELYSQLFELRSLLRERCSPLSSAYGMESTTEVEENLNVFILHLAEPPFKRLGWEARDKESNNDALLRPLLIAALGSAGSPEVLAEAKTRFERHYNFVMSGGKGDAGNPKDLIPPDLRVAIYSTCMMHGGDGVYERLLNLHERATMHDERVRILHCVGFSRSESNVKRVIGFAFTDLVRKQDRSRPLRSLSVNSAIGRRAVWDVIRQRIDTLAEDLGTQYLMGCVLKACCEGFCSKSDYEEVDKFFKEHPVPCARTVQQALETIAVNMNLMDREADKVAQFLARFIANIPK